MKTEVPYLGPQTAAQQDPVGILLRGCCLCTEPRRWLAPDRVPSPFHRGPQKRRCRGPEKGFHKARPRRGPRPSGLPPLPRPRPPPRAPLLLWLGGRRQPIRARQDISVAVASARGPMERRRRAAGTAPSGAERAGGAGAVRAARACPQGVRAGPASPGSSLPVQNPRSTHGPAADGNKP